MVLTELTGALHGISFLFRTDYGPLRTYAAEHLAPVLEQGASATRGSEVRVLSCLEWVEGQPWSRAHWSALTEKSVRVDRDLFLAQDELLWFRVDDLRDLVLHVRHTARSDLCVEGTFFFRLGNSALSDRLRRWRLGKRVREFERRRFPTLVSYLVYYPVWWLGETEFGRYPIHAAAVATPRGAILLAGASGVGKSSISTALAAEEDNRLLSDSFVLVQGRTVFAVPEPILLDPQALGWLGTRARWLQPIQHRYMLDRSGYRIAAEKFQARADAGVLVFPRRGKEWSCRPLGADRAWQRLTAGNFMVNDLRRYYALAAAWEQLRPSGLVFQRERAAEELTRGVPAFEVEIPPALPADVVVERIMNLLDSSSPTKKHD